MELFGKDCFLTHQNKFHFEILIQTEVYKST